MPHHARPTASACPRCGTLVAATVVPAGADLELVRACPRCGTERLPWRRDAAFHDHLAALVDTSHARVAGAVFAPLGDAPPPATDIKVDVTERCNYTCPSCFSRSGPDVEGGLDLAFIQRELGRFAGLRHKPDVSLIGGEPTLRRDLPELVAWLTERGFSVKLNTNGHLLTDRELVGRLHAAGLRWVILQLDGFDQHTIDVIRGKPASLARKLEAIRVLSEAGMQIVLVATVVRGLNDGELARLIDFGLGHERVVQVALLPVSNLGRNAMPAPYEGEYDLVEFLETLERETGGRVTKRDFLQAGRIWRGLSRLLGPWLRGRSFGIQPKTCLMATFVVGRPGDYVALNRLLHPRVALANVRRVADVLRAVVSILGWKRGAPIRSLVGVYVEKFLDAGRMDWAEVEHCTKYYLTEHGYVTDCVYNCLCRGEPVERWRPFLKPAHRTAVVASAPSSPPTPRAAP